MEVETAGDAAGEKDTTQQQSEKIGDVEKQTDVKVADDDNTDKKDDDAVVEENGEQKQEENGKESEGEEEEMDSDDDDNDDENDSDSEDQAIKELQALVSEQPQLYDKHIQLIELLKQTGELDLLRDARENMNKNFPLSPELWLAWIADERKFMEDGDANEKIQRLFKRATREYLSVDVWFEHCMFNIHNMEAVGSDGIREVFENALTACGLHVSKGIKIWEAYREFEAAILAGLQPTPGSVSNQDEQKAIDEQTERVKKLFVRQLGQPLQGMAVTHEEYKEWVTDDVGENVDNKYKKSCDKLAEVMPFEDQLVESASQASQAPQVEVYQKYIDYELSHEDPARIQCIFERAVTDQCLIPNLWLQYTKYLDRVLQSDSLISRAYERAVRNCPWSVDLWLGYVRAFERQDRSKQTVKEVFDRAMTGGGFTSSGDYLLIWTALVDYTRRGIEWDEKGDELQQDIVELRQTFEAAVNYFAENFPQRTEAPVVVPLLKYWARVEAKFCGNMEKARELWTEVPRLADASQAQLWLDYFNLERAYGDHKHARKVLQKALNSVSDWPEGIVDAYMTFEREEGTLEQYDQATLRCEKRMKIVEERRQQAAEAEEYQERKRRQFHERKPGGGDRGGRFKSNKHGGETQDYQQQQQQPKKGGGRFDKNAGGAAAASKGGFNKKQRPGLGSGRDNAREEEPVMKQVPVYSRGGANKPSSTPQQDAAAEVKMDADGFKVPSLPAPASPKSSATPPPGFKAKSGPPPGFKGKSAPPPGFKRSEEPDAEGEEQEPPAKKLKVDEAGSGDATADADAPTEKDSDYGETESRTAFVSNLAFSVEEDVLQQVFEKVGEITEIRLIKGPGGRPKGFGYIEFKDELSVLKAMELDRTPLEGRPMYVSKCEPKKDSRPVHFKYATEMEQNKVFVSGLPFSATNEDLKELFGEHGTLTGIRIVTARNGKSKGLAYIEYETPQMASVSVMKLDNHEMDGRVISVAISNPPSRKAQKQQEFTPTLGGGKKEGVDRGGSSRTMLSFQPRALQKPPQPKRAAAAAKPGSTPAPAAGNGNTDGDKPTSGLSNADFRSMLLKKK